MFKLKSLFRSVAAVGLAAGSLTAHAGLEGSTVNLKYYYPNVPSAGPLGCDSGNATVGAGIEYQSVCNVIPVSVDLSDAGFSVATPNAVFGGGVAFNGFLIDVVSGPAFDTVTFLGGGLGVTDVSVVGGDIWVNFAGKGTGGSLQANFSFTTVAGSVPEPSTLALLGGALLFGGLARRFRRG